VHAGITAWIAFNAFVLAMLAIDLGIFNRKVHIVRFREALTWSIIWISLALLFNLGLYHFKGPEVAQEFLAGYLIEKSLSVDNIFVFILIFSYFKIERKYQHRILFWGILGALIFRGILIAAGAALISRFHFVIYIFGAFLILTGIRMAIPREEDIDPGNSPVFRLARRILPVTSSDRGKLFLVRENHKWYVTPIFLVLLVVETTDIVFALDSIPAIFAVTKDAFIVYTSNVFAILGLRALYFLLAGVMGMFRYLKLGLSAVLIFVGIKMLIGHTRYAIPVNAALMVIAGILFVSIVASIMASKRDEIKGVRPPDSDRTDETE
jgi:tellurite resistance protein TerC